ncbi:hypothetical protein A2303_00275 [Candidatus Falkowbacteria bacterium RIFOXYB2_FULL_47_14]|uniref:Uncharacterized protein n=1 Tax=Candidatus Falkowbacteria bacterium RIFOXYA2_FULL_47_19 TaxID=1797994 RepID=A0A1F5SNI0_9BACT|nr:MAG: hypothetical protein A2227_05450 [Candidatus Falkowbacteria bacterium RIFOXYA2_FULL_47_19]OGF36478.1 MAG: hypothetical protein A2468_04910 [Candidatus Falkowbacteria bacterium RIFOXYC2_FULL_46_15]OGF42994.1 MAG: hypothetical protein A2303_00275 [Candidatus Falkowbacteria bacterium RIFOXYB2_FULL_47_14]
MNMSLVLENYHYIIYGAVFLLFSYFFVNFVFDLLLRGFSPFLPSRPWVTDQILSELKLPEDNPVIIALSSGRSGFFHALEKKYQKRVTLIGVEMKIFPYIVAKVQSWIRLSGIKVIKSPIHRVNVKEARLIYCHLYPPDMAGLGKKFKFECRPGTVIVSTGFNIPFLTPKKTIDLPDRKGRFDIFSRNQNLFQRKNRKFKKEKRAYFYEI